MQIAKIQNGQVIEVGYYRDLFPNTSFTTAGPNAEFLAENSCLPVVNPTCDLTTQKLVSIPPTIVSDHVETYVVQELTAAEKTPAQVSPRQIRQALTAMSLRTAVEAAVASGDQDTKDWWEFATVIERNHPMVLAMATALGVTDEQLDVLFTLAGSL